MTTVVLPSLVWTAAADPQALAGYETVEFDWLLRAVVAPALRAGKQRSTLENPARAWLDRLAAMDALAVLGVRLHTLDDLCVLRGYVLEPVWRAGVKLLVECEGRLTQLERSQFCDGSFGYPYTLERALHAARQIWRPTGQDVRPEDDGSARSALDAEQLRAARAPGGTVQIIAPAGSGKTTVLIERVRVLLRRGVPAERILATTFNRDAGLELKERLAKAGVRSVEARTFHSLGLRIMREEGIVRPGEPRQLSLSQWKRLCTLAMRETGTWVDPGQARAAVGEIKLGLLTTPEEFATEHAGVFPDGATIASIYALYERDQADRGVNDFDDMVMLAVRALREDDGVRRRWQGRFSHVLVDEYQDIEPAQELLVRILAAPQDELFCVGDDDQTLYGFRRASVRRMIDLDHAYPGLERVALAHNYRCPPAVVAASRQLIDHNRVRFPKAIEPAPGRCDRRGAIELRESDTQTEGAAGVATTLAGHQRGEIVVLARTTNLLRTVALACAAEGVKISAPARVFESSGARQTIEAYLRLCADPRHAQADDIATVCRRPNRGLPYETEARVAELLRAGFSFTESLAGLPASEYQRSRLDQAGRVLDLLAGMTEAPRFVRYLRSAGGLDEYFSEHEDAFGDIEQIDIEVLGQAEIEAAEMSVAAYSELLAARAEAVREIRDDAHGIELATIHGAKGRQWPRVELFACEEAQLPHRRALDVTDAERAAGEGEEAERRLAYVAFTRAQQQLVITTSVSSASRFLTEAGLSPKQPYHPAEDPHQIPVARPQRGAGRPAKAHQHRTQQTQPKPIHDDPKVAQALKEAERSGLSRALRTAPDRRTSLETAAVVIERHLVGANTTSEQMTAGQLFDDVEQLTDAERANAIAGAGVRASAIVARLGVGAQRRLVKQLRSLA